MTITARTFTQPSDVADYAKALQAADLDYHWDDEPSEVFEWMDDSELAVICQNHQALWAFCERSDVCPFELADGMVWIVNKNDHYFQSETSLDREKLSGCEVFNSKAAAVQHLCLTLDLLPEEVEHGFYIIRSGYIICDRGYEDEVEGMMETYISEFEL